MICLSRQTEILFKTRPVTQTDEKSLKYSQMQFNPAVHCSFTELLRFGLGLQRILISLPMKMIFSISFV